jgi:hypothetical protein
MIDSASCGPVASCIVQCNSEDLDVPGLTVFAAVLSVERAAIPNYVHLRYVLGCALLLEVGSYMEGLVCSHVTCSAWVGLRNGQYPDHFVGNRGRESV